MKDSNNLKKVNQNIWELQVPKNPRRKIPECIKNLSLTNLVKHFKALKKIQEAKLFENPH